MKRYIYPKLPASIDLYFIRLGGAGLANCLFVAARAYHLAKEYNIPCITPTWLKFSPGPYLRKEKDKRHYGGLFKPSGIGGFKKIVLLVAKKKTSLEKNTNGIIEVAGLGTYFADLIPHYEVIQTYFSKIIRPQAIKNVTEFDFTRCIGIHIRLGDYLPELRTDIVWYSNIIDEIEKNTTKPFRYLLFSDGTDSELGPILAIEKVERTYFGNAIADIMALSRCQLIIGSDSTFSGWGAFLGQVPIIFPSRHFGPVLQNSSNEIVLNECTSISNNFLNRVLGS